MDVDETITVRRAIVAFVKNSFGINTSVDVDAIDGIPFSRVGMVVVSDKPADTIGILFSSVGTVVFGANVDTIGMLFLGA